MKLDETVGDATTRTLRMVVASVGK